MEISGSINQPVNFYTKNTENKLNTYFEGENRLYQETNFASEFNNEKITVPVKKLKKHRKNKRLNTYDSDYLPDEITDSEQMENNFFIEHDKNDFFKNLKKDAKNILNNTPLINYFYLKDKEQKIAKTVKELNNISQNVDELINTTVPFGENSDIYSDIAKNLTNAVNIIGEANKNF